MPLPHTSIYAMLPSIPRGPSGGHVLLSAGGGSRVLPRTQITPLWPPRRSLQHNGLNEQTKQAIKDAAGTGIEIQF